MPMQQISTLLVDLDSINEFNEVDFLNSLGICVITFGELHNCNNVTQHINIGSNKIIFYMTEFLSKVIELNENVCFSELAVLSAQEELLYNFMKYRIYTIRYLSGNTAQSGFEQYGQLADAQIDQIDDLPRFINATYRGYVSEIFSEKQVVKPDKSNSMLYCKIRIMESPCGQSVKCIMGGRYFNTSDSRHFYHPLSVRLIKSKKDYISQHHIFYEIYKALIGVVKRKSSVDVITSVPPRPGSYDRFAYYVEALSKEHGIEKIDRLLYCTKDYKSQKSLNQVMRQQNLIGVFECSGNLKGKNVILLDDILTTGATTLTVADTLYQAGASSVTIVVLAVNQFENNTNYRICMPCEKCGNGFLKLRIGGYGLFWGCTNYPSCNLTMQYEDGEVQLKQYIEKNFRKVLFRDKILM